MPRRTSAVLAALLVLLVAACATPQYGATPQPTPPPTTSSQARLYAFQVEEMTFALRDSAAALTRLVANPDLTDEQWRNGIAGALQAIGQAEDVITHLAPPTDLEQAHALFRRASLGAGAAANIVIASAGQPDEADRARIEQHLSQMRTDLTQAEDALHTYLRDRD